MCEPAEALSVLSSVSVDALHVQAGPLKCARGRDRWIALEMEAGRMGEDASETCEHGDWTGMTQCAVSVSLLHAPQPVTPHLTSLTLLLVTVLAVRSLALSLPFCLRSNHPATLQEQSALQPPTLHLAHLSNHVLKRKCAPRRLLPSLDASPMAWHPACSCPSAQPRTDSRQACPAGRSLSGQKPADLEGTSTAGKTHAGAQSMHLHRQAGSPSSRASLSPASSLVEGLTHARASRSRSLAIWQERPTRQMAVVVIAIKRGTTATAPVTPAARCSGLPPRS